MDFRKVIYENVEKKPIHFTTNIGHRHFEVLWSFILFILWRFVLSFKSRHYAYIPPPMHKSLPTLGNKKEQQRIKFYEKSSGELIFLRTTKNFKWSISLARLSKWSKSKVTPLAAITENYQKAIEGI